MHFITNILPPVVVILRTTPMFSFRRLVLPSIGTPYNCIHGLGALKFCGFYVYKRPEKRNGVHGSCLFKVKLPDVARTKVKDRIHSFIFLSLKGNNCNFTLHESLDAFHHAC